MRSVLLVIGVAGLVGCSSPLSPTALSGDWLQETEVPGVFFGMSLAANGSSLTGFGNACGEALPCASFTVTGRLEDDGDVVLDFVYATARRDHFVGRLGFDTLRGQVTTTDGMPSLPPGPTPYVVVFHRTEFPTVNI